jgi:cytochrome d ubiquinol oxidase subunit II
MTLNSFWFLLIAVLWIGYFILEGFDFGVGILLRVLGKDEAQRRTMLTTLGPVWDGNEVWLLVAGGATFAAFPEWYATLFSGFYLALFIILLSLIVRGVSFEYRSKYGSAKWRNRWDTAITVSSTIPALLWGVAFANIVRGVPLKMSAAGYIEYSGGFFNLLNLYAILGGATTLFLFITHGAIFISLKTDGDLRIKARFLAIRTGLITAVLAVAFLVWTLVSLTHKPLVIAGVVAIVVVWVASIAFNYLGKEGWAFFTSALTTALVVATLFEGLYPNVLPSNNGGPSLGIFNASSSHYTLKVMTIVALVMTPIVLLYQGWTYWVFRKRISPSQIANPQKGVLDTVNQ